MAPAVVAIELRVSRRRTRLKYGPVGDENILGSVVVVIEDSGAGSGALQEVLLLLLAAESIRYGQAALSRNVDEANGGGVCQKKEGQGCDGNSRKADEHLSGPDLPQRLDGLLGDGGVAGLGGLAQMFGRAGHVALRRQHVAQAQMRAARIGL